MDLRDFTRLFDVSLLGRMPSESETSGVFVTGETTFFGFIWDRDVCQGGSWTEEFNAHVHAAREHRLPFLAVLPSSIEDEVDGASIASMKMAVLEAKEVVPTALIERHETEQNPTGSLGAPFDLAIRISQEEHGSFPYIRCATSESAKEKFELWLDIMPSSRESILLPDGELPEQSTQAVPKSPGFWSENYVASIFDRGSTLSFSNFKRHNVHGGLGLVHDIPAVFVIPEIERNEALITASDSYLMINLLELADRYGIPVIFGINGGSRYDSRGIDFELMTRVADKLRTISAPIISVGYEPVSDSSQLISHVAVKRSEDVHIRLSAQDGEGGSWPDLAHQLFLACRKFAVRRRQRQ